MPNTPARFFKPTKAEILAATSKTVPDVIAPNLKILFVGINPGLYTAAVGHHFARPGNRFWPALQAGGFTARLVSPFEEHDLLKAGYGITNMVSRATNLAGELTKEELVRGGRRLETKVRRYRPKWVAILGVQAYRVAFNHRRAVCGRQAARIGTAATWLLPNPSGLNAHYTPKDLARLFRALHLAADKEV